MLHAANDPDFAENNCAGLVSDWFHGLSNFYKMFLFCSTAGFVCMTC